VSRRTPDQDELSPNYATYGAERPARTPDSKALDLRSMVRMGPAQNGSSEWSALAARCASRACSIGAASSRWCWHQPVQRAASRSHHSGPGSARPWSSSTVSVVGDAPGCPRRAAFTNVSNHPHPSRSRVSPATRCSVKPGRDGLAEPPWSRSNLGGAACRRCYELVCFPPGRGVTERFASSPEPAARRSSPTPTTADLGVASGQPNHAP
jgi:hypothetical protein